MGTTRARPMRVRRAAVVEEYAFQRMRIGEVLSEGAGLQVVHHTSTLGRFLAWLRRTERERWPHLLIVNPSTGPDSSRELKMVAMLQEAGMRILVLSPLRSRSIALRLLDAGVAGVASVEDGEREVLGLVKTVLAGGTALTPRAHEAIRGLHGTPRLSQQERRVLALYAAGLSIAQVADRLEVMPDTARKYLARVRDKYTAAGRSARTKLDLARIAWTDGYVDMDLGADFPVPRSMSGITARRPGPGR